MLYSKRALEHKIVNRGRVTRKVWRVLVEWTGLPRDEVTWEDYDDIGARYPCFLLEDKDIIFKKGRMTRPPLVN